MTDQRRGAVRSTLIRAIPPFAGWQTFPRATTNVLIAALAVTWTVWTVHQTEYLIEYRQGFTTVMTRGPHAAYMGQVGLLLILSGGLLWTVMAHLLGRFDDRRSHIQRRLPYSWARALPSVLPQLRVNAGDVARTAGLFLVLQIAVYTLQENLEIGFSTGAWPGLAVLWGIHVTVIPLHILGASSASCFIWVASHLLRHSAASLHLAGTLERIAAGTTAACRLPQPLRSRVPRILRPVSGCEARAPPAIADSGWHQEWTGRWRAPRAVSNRPYAW